VIACTGCTPAQAWSEWDIPSLTTQMRYWRRHPPVHMLAAAYLDYKPPATSEVAAAVANTVAADALITSAPELPEHLRRNLPPNPYAKRPT